MAILTMREALNQAMREEMARDPEVFLLGEEVLKSTCAETKGTWSPARCPADRKLGGCAMTGQLRVYYPGGDFDYSSDTAQKDCTELFQGRWVASR